jgi:hypothetical protein
MAGHRYIICCAAAICSISAQTARATPADVCALLTPFFDKPPQHFIDLRGVKTSDRAWTSKANPAADALNAVCGLTAYVEHRINYNCTVKFDENALAEQEAFFQSAVVGVDYCMGSLNFGTNVRRATSHSYGGPYESDSVDWYRTDEKNGKSAAEFGATITKSFHKSTKSRAVDITLFYEQP